ncbi:MAG: fibronectin type III domain-containing protein [Bacteroidota bacterium]
MTLNTNSKLIRSLSEQFNLKKTLLCAVAILGLASSALAQCDGSLSVSIQSTEATCGQANAALTSTVSGGTEPYAYAWNNSSSDANQSNLSAGVYSLTVTDNNGCTASASATVASVSCPVVATQSITNVIQNAATVNWSSVDCAVKYRIIVINVNTQVQQIYFTLAPATSFTIPNLEPNTPYTVRIRTQCTETGASV